MKIFIDPGHGGTDPGAVSANGMGEASVNLDVALRLGKILQTRGQTVHYSRTTNKNVSLSERARMANDWGANYFISIHCNSAADTSAKGAETFYYRNGTIAERLARSIQASLIAQTLRRDRGIKTGNLAVLRLTRMPAVLVELAFISNPEEARLLASSQFKQNCAVGIANGVMAFLTREVDDTVDSSRLYGVIAKRYANSGQ